MLDICPIGPEDEVGEMQGIVAVIPIVVLLQR